MSKRVPGGSDAGKQPGAGAGSGSETEAAIQVVAATSSRAAELTGMDEADRHLDRRRKEDEITLRRWIAPGALIFTGVQVLIIDGSFLTYLAENHWQHTPLPMSERQCSSRWHPVSGLLRSLSAGPLPRFTATCQPRAGLMVGSTLVGGSD